MVLQLVGDDRTAWRQMNRNHMLKYQFIFLWLVAKKQYKTNVKKKKTKFWFQNVLVAAERWIFVDKTN